jgi:radical SAM protein with 4Fe4S-binding SPASM domain
MNNNKNTGLGFGKITQFSIDEKIDQEKIEKLFSNKINEMENYLQDSNDNFAQELLDYFKKNKKIKFLLNKHEEIFIINNQNDFIKIFKYLIFRYKYMRCSKEKINLGYPPYLLIEPVSACNLRCPFCFQTDTSFTRKPYMGVMEFDLFKKIIDEANDLGICAVTLASRGEPTMHKQFAEMLEYINSKKNIFEIKINTNGNYLTEKICHAILKNKVTQIIISSDHYIKKDYERLRLNSNFEKTVENVDRLFNIRKKYYPKSIIEIRISGIDNEKKLNREKFKEFWIKRSDHVTASFPEERWNTYKNKKTPKANDPCVYLWERMYIWFDGKVNPCDLDYKSYLSYGNFKNNGIKEIWNNKTISQLRNDHLKEKRKNIVPCDRCGLEFNK